MNAQNLISVKGFDQLPLGFLAWYSVPSDLKVSQADLELAFDEVGMDRSRMPDPIRPHDAFRRATAKVQAQRVPAGPDAFNNFLVREVRSDKKEVRRHLVIETVNGRDAVLEYREAGSFRLLRATSMMHTEAFPEITGDELKQVESILAAAKENYREALKFYEGDHVRRMISNILACLNPTLVRPSGAVYFVPQKYQGDLEKLEALSKRVSAEFVSVPVMDAENVRDIVLNAFRAQTMETVNTLAEALKDESITPKRATMLLEQAKSLLAQVREYESLLERNLSDMQSQVEIVQMQMRAVVDRIAA